MPLFLLFNAGSLKNVFCKLVNVQSTEKRMFEKPKSEIVNILFNMLIKVVYIYITVFSVASLQCCL